MFYAQIPNPKQTLDLTSRKYTFTKKNQTCMLHLRSKSFLLAVMLYFDKYPLYGKKQRQYHQWKRFVKYDLLKSCDSELKIQQLKRLIQLYRKQ